MSGGGDPPGSGQLLGTLWELARINSELIGATLAERLAAPAGDIPKVSAEMFEELTRH